MHYLWMAIIGLVAGALAKVLTPGKDGGGILVTMVLGLAGAFLAGFIGRAMGLYNEPGAGPGLIVSTVGAIVVLAIYHFVARRRLAH